MIATKSQQKPKEGLSPKQLDLDSSVSENVNTAKANMLGQVKNFNLPAQSLLQNRMITHHPKSGLNPIVDAASYLFSVLGKIKQLELYRQHSKLHKELVQEINAYQEAIKTQGYNTEYVIVCRYILCATFDDIIENTTWGGQGQWDSYSLLSAYNQDPMHHDKFFNILERAIKEPALYIDLMELIYIALSLGYKGQYRATEHNLFQLEQITHHLYKHIRAYRGSFSKFLSPTPLRPVPKMTSKSAPEATSSAIFILFVAICIVMTIFISLGYLMDVISNEAYKNIGPTESSFSHEISR